MQMIPEPAGHPKDEALAEHRERRRGCGAWLVLLASLVLLVGCGASEKSLGLRPGYEEVRLRKVAMIPFYATGSFSLEPAEQEALRRLYEEAAAKWLRDRKLELVDAPGFEAHLKQNKSWERFRQGVDLRLPLTEHFEPIPGEESPGLEVETLRKLHAEGKLPADVVLVAEIVYQTSTMCSLRADNYSSQAQVVVRPSAPDEMPRPCVVSHFQAKLVDAASGDTMWYSRKLRELHTDKTDERTVAANIMAVIDGTFGGEYGITVITGKVQARR